MLKIAQLRPAETPALLQSRSYFPSLLFPTIELIGQYTSGHSEYFGICLTCVFSTAPLVFRAQRSNDIHCQFMSPKY